MSAFALRCRYRVGFERDFEGFECVLPDGECTGRRGAANPVERLRLSRKLPNRCLERKCVSAPARALHDNLALLSRIRRC